MDVPAEEKVQQSSDKVQYPHIETFDSAEAVKPPMIMEKDFADESKQSLEEKKEIHVLWKADLYDTAAPCPCCEPTDLCCMATFCPYVVFGNIAAMLEKGKIVPACSYVGCCREECFIAYAIDAFSSFLMSPIYGFPLSAACAAPVACGMRYGWLSKYLAKTSRLKIQEKYGIADDPEAEATLCRQSCQLCVTPEAGCCGDSPHEARAYCSHFWCNCCALMQEYKTIKAAIRAQEAIVALAPSTAEMHRD